MITTGDGSSSTSITTTTQNSKKPTPKPPPKRFIHTPIPTAILNDASLNAAISLLPSTYSFEIHKTAHRLQSSSSRRAALQLPDGLLMFALSLADILSAYVTTGDVIILADPTYGACCLADRAASALSADVMVHYGHSCLVPVTSSLLPVLYVFVEIKIDPARLAETIKINFPNPTTRFAIAGTIQFISAVHAARQILQSDGYDNIIIPQSKPLSAGEVLGCTAPTLPKSDGIEAVIFVADGRFHLEAFMIANPGVRAFRYDPFLGVLVLEEYDYVGMKRARRNAILAARKAQNWGVILGTLGRQGSTKVLDRVVEHMEEKGLEYTVVLMSEISPGRMELFGDSVDAWVQIACPRLSIDWGEEFRKPMLTTFEFDVALGYFPGWWEREGISGGGCLGCPESGSCGNGGSCGGGGGLEADYPMDYYAQDGGDWNSSYMKKRAGSERRPRLRVGK